MTLSDARRLLTAALSPTLLLGAIACDVGVVRYDFVAEGTSGERLSGSFTVSPREQSGPLAADPTVSQFPVESAVVGGEPARGMLEGGAVAVFDDAGATPEDAFAVALRVDSLPRPAVLSLFLTDPSGGAFASDALPFPFPPLETFDRAEVTLTPIRTPTDPAPEPFRGRIVSFIARAVPTAPPVSVE